MSLHWTLQYYFASSMSFDNTACKRETRTAYFKTHAVEVESPLIVNIFSRVFDSLVYYIVCKITTLTISIQVILSDHISQSVIFFVNGEYCSVWHFGILLFDDPENKVQEQSRTSAYCTLFECKVYDLHILTSFRLRIKGMIQMLEVHSFLQ